ncbi:uncharacterized protein MYCGRDRAFT_108013 [Zymoseptoria tritici IPO323]|uniref:Uncharacterized protein n=1 Tax=Zymoseptoria tritici (strain CBS 115943 / IPO323) TaxID=336722 RepID=F9X4E0_ZYMTI|nr:uncharacterized protein MYCGRDRAFT_108013 [Zymoseptoria tritici IPO323]EGP90584.1 hypothetical protein MYCGRDRAFT_108013 [Zymoseptoria tritici IPO323]
MDPTTLVTFLFGAPLDVHTVELLGSWDNFDRPYQMHHDRRRGTGFWSGCFRFQDIIFDGDGFRPMKQPRSGGLKQGGTYWYFYRLNYDIDTHDARQPSTTFCPLLPGQPVNVIEVPCEIVELPSRCQSAYGEMMGSLLKWQTSQTLDPASKYAMLEPPPISRVHVRCLSDYALSGRLENQPVDVVDDPVSPLSTASSEQMKTLDVETALPERHDVSRSSSVYSDRSLRSISPKDSDHQSDAYSFTHQQAPGLALLPSLEDLTQSTSFQLPSNLQRSDSGFQAIHCTKKKSAMSIGPSSIHNVQFYGSRPGTSLNDDPEQHRPRTYSIPHSVELCQSASPSRPVSPLSCHTTTTIATATRASNRRLDFTLPPPLNKPLLLSPQPFPQSPTFAPHHNHNPQQANIILRLCDELLPPLSRSGNDKLFHEDSPTPVHFSDRGRAASTYHFDVSDERDVAGDLLTLGRERRGRVYGRVYTGRVGVLSPGDVSF